MKVFVITVFENSNELPNNRTKDYTIKMSLTQYLLQPQLPSGCV